MTDVSAIPAAPAPPSLAKANLTALINVVAHLGTNWQTTAVGVAFVVLGIASAYGLPLPVVGGVQLSSDQLLLSGLGALGFLAAKDGNK